MQLNREQELTSSQIFSEVLAIQRTTGNLKLNREVWEAFDEECQDVRFSTTHSNHRRIG